jgi:hypothetical protein
MTLTWKILKLECIPNKDGLLNVITEAQFELLGVENINGIEYSGFSEGVAMLEEYGINNFTQFENVTKEQLINWIENTIHYRVALRKIKEDIEYQQKPKTISLLPPFLE